jgi:ribonuclease G
MSKELVIGSNRHETKVAILEEDQLVEVYFQRANEYSLAGSIHKGRVTRVLPGMQSAFVDLGLERDTFLYVSDFFEEHEDIDAVLDEKPLRSERPERGGRGERRDRGGFDRPPQEIAIVAEARFVAAEIEPPDELTEEEEEAQTPAAVLPPAAAEARPLEQAKPVARHEDDRGRNNDQRGRRSRRRRRGRDFPDKKYARPNTLPNTPPSQSSTIIARLDEATPPTDQAKAELKVEPRREEVTDVIVLPGESLAKYRSRPVVSAPLPSPAVVSEPVIESPSPEQLEEEAEIAEEAAEITIAEQVFGHQAPAEIEPVPEPAPEQQDAIGRAASYLGVDRGHADAREEERLRVERFLTDPLPANLPEPDESELLAADESLPEVEDLAPEIEEALENGIDEPYFAAAAVDADVEPPAAQSAVVRDQGNRSLHRAPRRMRRRRGGSGRFNQGGPGNTAAAPTPQAEQRPDSKGEAPVFEERTTERPERAAMPSISELLKPGQEIIVQIAKEPLGQKGARITSHIALPGRYVVFMPSVAHLGVSRKVSSEEERLRLKRILQTHREGTSGGFIVRTAGEGVPEEEIAADMSFLYSLWLDIRQKAEKKPAPALLHYDLDIVQRILRDQVTDEFKAIWVDTEDLYESVVNFMQRHQPALVNRVKMYTRSAPVFDAFNITQELEKALRPKVWLKSGGYIVINQTEALVAIDINTGKFVGKSNRLEDTIVKTNVEAVKEIVRQIRLRDLGGIIVVDFIDMDERKNRQRVMQALEEAMRADKAPYKILQFNDFGLVAITRKRVKQSLERTLCSPCPHCEGAGYVKSVQTVIGEILVEAQKISKAIESKDVMLRVHPDVAKVLKAKDNQYLEELEEILARPVMVKGDPTLHNEKFDLG